MAFGTSIGKGSFKLRQQDRWWGYFYLTLLIVAALILFTVNLGNHPLDRLETTTVEIAEEILQTPVNSWRWFLPRLEEFNSLPSLYPQLVALAYHFGGVSPLTTRLPAALLGTLATAFVYGIGRELFKTIIPALLACCVYITFFPVVAWSRLGTADLPVMCFEMLALWAILRSRRNLRWSLIAGFGLSLVCLTDLWAFFPLIALIILFLLWDTPRLLSSSFFYCGVILGIIPLIVFAIAQINYYEPTLVLKGGIGFSAIALKSDLAVNWLRDRSFSDYLAIALSYCSPWSIVAVSGLKLAWYHRNWGWAKFLLTASGVCGLFTIIAIALRLGSVEMAFHLSVLLICPILALAAGIQLHQLRNLPSYIRYPQSWVSLFGSEAAIFLVVGICSQIVFKIGFSWLLLAIFASIILTLIVSSLSIVRKDFQFVHVLIWGSYLSLLLVFGSQYGN